MEHKIFEVRDSGTCMVMLGYVLRPNPISQTMQEINLLMRAGYGPQKMANCFYIGLFTLDGGEVQGSFDPYSHPPGARTRSVAHDYIMKNWRTLKSGDVIDVEFILGETKQPKQSEINFGS